MRSWVERVADAAFVAVTVAAGAVAALAPVLLPGLVLGGSACGGGGNAQRCTGIARQLSLVNVSPRAWAYVVGGRSASCSARRRIVLSLAILAVAFVGLVQTSRIDAKLGPSAGGTYARPIDDWGAFLSPALRELRQDALRRYGGRRTEPGGPRYDREQILGSFSVREQDGWRILHVVVVVAFFAAGLESVRRVVRRPSLAIVTASTAGLVVWAAVVDRSTRCDPGASECYRGLTTLLAVAAAGLGWAGYLAGFFVGRLVDRSSSGARHKVEDRGST
ncbi:MAG: hypothetical protein H0U07_14785 [Actinobacteria bacterium]|nr:hypothetical protein [Actinomycetota bacterium]